MFHMQIILYGKIFPELYLNRNTIFDKIHLIIGAKSLKAPV